MEKRIIKFDLIPNLRENKYSFSINQLILGSFGIMWFFNNNKEYKDINFNSEVKLK